jgi:hypothetical protein
MLAKTKRIYRNQGLIRLLKKIVMFAYDNYIRTLFPKRTVQYNDIPVRASHLGDSIIPWHTKDIPGYEKALIRGIRQFVQNGDTVIVVGGGWGVSTVASAIETEEDGYVTTYEGGDETVEKVADTVQLNDVEDRVSVRHAIVGQALSLRDDPSNAETVSPTKLPRCDVLVLDCEGAELEILDQMEIRPRVIIVETHGMLGATKEDVGQKLVSNGYETGESMIAEERLRGICEKNDIYVLFSHLEKIDKKETCK